MARKAGVSFHPASEGGEAGGLLRAKDWSVTPLGPREAWSRSLHNCVEMILALPTAAIVFWGPERIQLYNDGYSVIMGPRHPRHLGSRFRDCWPEAFEAIHPWMERVDRGETVEVERTLVPLTRFGFTEEAYFTFSFSPLRDDAGRIAGVLQLVTEMTDAVLGDRRAEALRALSDLVVLRNPADAVRASLEVLARFEADLPEVDIAWLDRGTPSVLGLRAVAERKLVLDDRAFAVPITTPDRTIVAVLGGRLSAKLAVDDGYRGFVQLVAGQLGTVIAAARARDDEQQRIDSLIELDRAKTTFFNDISHEFRTPLTLLLGPVEDALADPVEPLAAGQRRRLELVRHNAARLSRLVNALLDFARMEGGQLRANRVPTDLGRYTTELASGFAVAMERAGLAFRVECPPSSAPALVDRDMWERIVLNLLSNALKFTLAGEVAIRLHEASDGWELVVRDTGIGVPAAELPRMFERFHRVAAARGRSQEGTGIGLSLVHGLVQLHEGTIDVASEEGRGTTMTIRLPRVAAETAPAPVAPARPSLAAAAFRDEGLGWVPTTDAAVTPAPARSGLVLVVDDNADLRAYLTQLLAPHYEVETATNGARALERIRRRRPHLVVTDVMMPELDGIGLLRALRADDETRTIPVILLSARAGEEALVEGLDAGADDYLAKPFTRNELLARVRTHLELSELRRRQLVELETLVRAQKEAIRELSTPVLRVRDRFLVAPLIGVLDAERARGLYHAILGGIRAHRAQTVVVDVTGVPAVDEDVAAHLVRCAEAGRLMGARVLFTGISEEAAVAMARLGQLPAHTFASLEDGIAAAL